MLSVHPVIFDIGKGNVSPVKGNTILLQLTPGIEKRIGIHHLILAAFSNRERSIFMYHLT